MNDVQTDAFLEHFGIKGMHWGIRNKKEEKPLTKAEIIKRKKMRQALIKGGIRGGIITAAIMAPYVAAFLSEKKFVKVNNIPNNVKSNSVKDIINSERDVKLSSLKRMHKEGKMDKTQAENFIKILNDRYDRKIADAVKEGLK